MGPWEHRTLCQVPIMYCINLENKEPCKHRSLGEYICRSGEQRTLGTWTQGALELPY